MLTLLSFILVAVVALFTGVALEQYIADFIEYGRSTFSVRYYAWYVTRRWPADFYHIVIRGGR